MASLGVVCAGSGIHHTQRSTPSRIRVEGNRRTQNAHERNAGDQWRKAMHQFQSQSSTITDDGLDASLYARGYACGQNAARTVLTRRMARAIAAIDTQYIDDWHPTPAYGHALSLCAAIEGTDDATDLCREDVEACGEKLLGKPYPEAAEVCGFVEGVAEICDMI
jgi:hypothetical protein